MFFLGTFFLMCCCFPFERVYNLIISSQKNLSQLQKIPHVFRFPAVLKTCFSRFFECFESRPGVVPRPVTAKCATTAQLQAVLHCTSRDVKLTLHTIDIYLCLLLVSSTCLILSHLVFFLLLYWLYWLYMLYMLYVLMFSFSLQAFGFWRFACGKKGSCPNMAKVEVVLHLHFYLDTFFSKNMESNHGLMHAWNSRTGWDDDVEEIISSYSDSTCLWKTHWNITTAYVNNITSMNAKWAELSLAVALK